MKNCVSILLFLMLMQSVAIAQTNENQNNSAAEQTAEDLIQNISEGNDGEIDFTDIFEQIELYKKKPLNLNRAQREDLDNLLLINDLQINALLAYRERFGNLISIYELQAVPHWDIETIKRMLPYTTIEEDIYKDKITLKNLSFLGTNDLIVRARMVVQQPYGYTEKARTSGNQYYLGNRQGLFVRYQYRFANRLSMGIVAEKDPGEQLFKGSQPKGFDFYSFHVGLYNQGKLKKLIIGDYRLQFGQGLVLWSGIGFAKSPFVMNIKRQGQGLNAYRSVNEQLFLRGIAATFQFKNIAITPFVSIKKTDGNIDTSNQESGIDFEASVSSILISGLHRTPNEVADKYTLGQILVGNNINYQKRTLQLGLTTTYVQLSNAINLNPSTYNQYYFQGKNLANASIDYAYSFKNLNIFGETALNSTNGLATVNGLLLALDPRISISAVYRNFSPRYHSFWANTFSNSRINPRNEQGLYTGFELKLIKNITLSGFIDRYRSNWLSFGSNFPSNGTDYLANIEYKYSRKIVFYARWRYRNEQRNAYNNTTPIDFAALHERHNLRLNAIYTVADYFTFQSRVELSQYTDGTQKPENGYLIFQDLKYKALSFPVQLSLRYALFDTKSYNTRIYAYESDVLYSFSIPPYAGRGSRFYAMARYTLTKGIDVWLRYAHTFYTDRNRISTGLEKVNGNLKSDVRLQIRYQF